MQNLYTNRCFKCLDNFTGEEARELLLDNEKNSDCISAYLSAREPGNLVSLFDILRRNSKLSMYYQMFPLQLSLTESQALQVF